MNAVTNPSSQEENVLSNGKKRMVKLGRHICMLQEEEPKMVTVGETQ